MQWTIERFPQLEGQIRRLAEQHRELKDEPLHLAMVYDPGRESQDIFLLEVLGRFGGDEASPDGEFFEVTYDSSRGFPMGEGQMLHLVLTNPTELQVGLKDRWRSAEEVRDALKRGDFEVLYEDEIGQRAMSAFHD